MEGKDMEKKIKEEKKVWIKPELVVYGDIEKLTAESPVPGLKPPRMGSGYS